MSGNEVLRHEPSLDQLLRLLSDPVKRRTLGYLAQQPDGGTSIGELEGALVASDDIDVGTGDQLALSLYHVHLPALADAGSVRVDREEELVYYESDERVEALLETIETFE